MINWNVEDYVLINDKTFNGNFSSTGNFSRSYFSWDYKLSKADKIIFLDSVSDGIATYILELLNKFHLALSTLKKDTYGNIKHSSLIPWLKKNDPKQVIDTRYSVGLFRFLGLERYLTNANEKTNFSMYADLIEEMFHQQLVSLYKKEKEHYLTSNPYETKLTRFITKLQYGAPTFGIDFSINSGSSGRSVTINNRRITMEQMDYMFVKWGQIDTYINSLAVGVTSMFKEEVTNG